MCRLGPQGAITFTTGPTPASALGINAKPSLQFERSTTCAPVNMNETYMTHRVWKLDNCTTHTFRYHYGWSIIVDQGSTTFDVSTYGNSREFWPSYILA